MDGNDLSIVRIVAYVWYHPPRAVMISDFHDTIIMTKRIDNYHNIDRKFEKNKSVKWIFN